MPFPVAQTAGTAAAARKLSTAKDTLGATKAAGHFPPRLASAYRAFLFRWRPLMEIEKGKKNREPRAFQSNLRSTIRGDDFPPLNAQSE